MKTAVIGSGAWGTALATLLCKNGHDTTLWCRSEARAAEIRTSRINPRLPQVRLPDNLMLSASPECVRGCRMVVIACPSFPIRSVCRTVAPYIGQDAVVVSVTKGIEEGTLLRMSQVVAQETGHEKIVALTGPCHAEEVATGLPTGCLAACAQREMAELVQDAFMSDTFRVYTSPDIIGAELGGALKNVIALCSGVVAGMGFIGAGTIIVTRRQRVKGLTTAAGLWTVAIVGLAIGAGFYEGGLLTTGLILLAELLFSKLEYHILANAPEVNLYMEYEDRSALDRVLKLYRDRQVKVSNMEITRQPGGEGNDAACALFTLRLNKHCPAGTIISDICAMGGVRNVEEI